MSLPLDPRSVAYWPLSEQFDSVLPAEAAGRLPTFRVPAGRARPPVTDDTMTGFGREYIRAEDPALVVTDSSGQTRLTGSMTVLAMVRLDLADLGEGDWCVIVQRGRGGGADPVSYRLALQARAPLADGRVPVRLALSWQTMAGDEVDAGWLEFLWPEGDGFVLIGAVREMVGGAFRVTYLVNERAVTRTESLALDCGGAASADLSLGVGMVGGDYGAALDGVIDSLEIVGTSISAEELEWLWYRLAVAIPEGIATMRGLVPPGAYSTDPESYIQRELAVEGTAIGYSKALARRLRSYLFPDVAFGVALERWEKLIAHSPKPGDSIATRRHRVLGFLRTIHGFTIADVQSQLAHLLDLAPEQIEILEYSTDEHHDFADGDPGGSIASDGVIYQFGRLDMFQGGADKRYGGMALPRAASFALWPVASGDDAWFQLRAVSGTASSGGCLYGLMLGRRSSDEWLFIGFVRSEAGGDPVVNLGWMRFRGGVLDSTVTTLAAGIDLESPYLWVHHVGGGNYEVRHGATVEAARTAAPIAFGTGHASPEWAGPFLGAPNSVDDTGGIVSAQFDDLFIRTPKGHQRFNWYAYRDPELPGSPDMIGARLVVDRIKPAHTNASACTVRALVCGDPANGCGVAPLGG